jgi:hypothetical protein
LNTKPRKLIQPLPLAKAVQALTQSAPANAPAPAPQSDLATLAAQAISKVDQLTAHLKSPDFAETVAQRVIQMLGVSGQLDELITNSLATKSQIIQDLVAEAVAPYLSDAVDAADPLTPETPQSTTLLEDEAANQPIGEPEPVAKTAEYVLANFCFIPLATDEKLDPETCIVFQAVMPSDMNPANTRINFFAVDDHGHLQQVILGPGYDQLALNLFRADPATYAFGQQYAVRIMQRHSAQG